MCSRPFQREHALTKLSPAVALMIRKLSRHHPLSPEDMREINALPFVLRQTCSSEYLVREGQQPIRCAFLMEGYAYRQKLTSNGERQIIAINLPGDFLDLQNLFLTESDHNVQALTSGIVVEMSLPAMRNLAFRRPAVGKAFWVATLIEASINREWLLNVGRRPAPERLAHLLCEIQVRVARTDASVAVDYELPMTQEQIGDALGLTSVHVNRVLKTLQKQGLINRDRRRLQVVDWPGLRALADFNERYLHLQQS